MALAQTFQEIVDSMTDDWSELEFDLRLADERYYVEASLLLAIANPVPYSKSDWHWRVRVAHKFGHGAAAPAVHSALSLLDDAGIEGEIALREVRSGRKEVVQMWGRPQSARDEFQKARAQ